MNVYSCAVKTATVFACLCMLVSLASIVFMGFFVSPFCGCLTIAVVSMWGCFVAVEVAQKWAKEDEKHDNPN